MEQKGKRMRFIGMVCWFLALVLLFTHAAEKKEQEAEAQNTVSETQMQPEEGSTILYPSGN